MAIVHIIGAGISGLAAATKLAEAHVPVRVYEATAYAGGRSRSVRDPKLGMIDSGLHLISGDSPELLAYLARIGTREALVRVKHPLRLVPAPLVDYLGMASMLLHGRGAADCLAADNSLRNGWARKAARNWLGTPFELLSAKAARRGALRFLARARRAAICYRTAQSLQECLVTPALTQLDYHGGSVYFQQPLKALVRSGGRVTQLQFARQTIAVAEDDVVILALPGPAAMQLLPEICAGGAPHSAITVHFACAHREPEGVTHPAEAPADRVRYQPGRISLSIRVAEAEWHRDPAFLAGQLWHWLQRAHPYLAGTALPPYGMHREKHAGHVVSEQHTPHLPALEPHLLIAGDWLEAHAPATLEGAARSGHHAAQAALSLIGRMPARRQ